MIINGEMGVLDTTKLDYPDYISIDPGDDIKPSTGITLWKDTKVIHTNELSVDSLHQLLDWLEKGTAPKEIIVEEYVLYQQKALQQSGSKLPAVQIIGIIKRSAYKMNIAVIEVRADSKKIAAQWSQTKILSGHMPNWMASYLIGFFHLTKIGVLQPKVLG